MDHMEVVDAVYRAAVSTDLWSSTLCSIADYVGATAGNIVYQSPARRGSFLIPARMREDLNSLYLEAYTGNPYARAFEKVQPGNIAVGNMLVDLDAVQRSAYYADICEPQDIFNQLFMPHASLHERGGIGGIALFLSRRQDDHVHDAERRLHRLAPHLARAIDLSLQTSRLTRGPELPQRLINVMPDPAVLIGPQGEIVMLNAAAERFFERADGMYLSRSNPPSICAHLAEASSALSSAIRRALAVSYGSDVPFECAMAVPRPSGGAPYLVMITPLPSAAFSPWEPVETKGRVLVHIVDPEAKTQLQARYLQQIFGLTDAETRVSELVGGGLNLPKIAHVLKVSHNTVKTHVGRVFEKTGVRSQAGLARLIAAIPVADPAGQSSSHLHKMRADLD